MPAGGFDSPGSSDPAQGPTSAAGNQDDAGDERLVTLTDGVVAIALTLLSLGIAVPAPDSLHNPDSVSALAGGSRWHSPVPFSGSSATAPESPRPLSGNPLRRGYLPSPSTPENCAPGEHAPFLQTRR